MKKSFFCLVILCLLSVLIVFTLVACDKNKDTTDTNIYGVKDSDKIDFSNIIDYMAIITDVDNEVIDFEIEALDNISNPEETITYSKFGSAYNQLGLFRINLFNLNTFTTKYGVTNDKEVIILPSYDEVNIQKCTAIKGLSIYEYYYIRIKMTSEGVDFYGLYTINGTFLAVLHPYDFYPSISLDIITRTNADGDVQQYEKLTITSTIDGLATDEVKYSLIEEDGSRTSVASIPEEPTVPDEYTVGDTITPDYLDASAIGLPDWFYTFEAINGKQNVIIYNENKEFVSQTVIPTTAINQILLNGNYFYQSSQNVPDDYMDYTVFDSTLNKKSVLNTYIIDFRTGRTKQIEFNYVITSVEKTINNEDGVPEYAVIKVYGIQNKLLADDYAIMIIDCNGKFVYNADSTHLNFTTLRKLNDNRYLYERGGTKYIVDNNLQQIVDITKYTYTIDYNEQIIVLKKPSGGNYGVIDFDGKVLIPFDYTTAISFVNGYAYANNSVENSYVCVDLQNNYTRTPTSAQLNEEEDMYYGAFSISGILYSIQPIEVGIEDNYTTIYKIAIITYDGTELAHFYKTNTTLDSAFVTPLRLKDQYGNNFDKYLIEISNVIKDENSIDMDTGALEYEYYKGYYIINK